MWDKKSCMYDLFLLKTAFHKNEAIKKLLVGTKCMKFI